MRTPAKESHTLVTGKGLGVWGSDRVHLGFRERFLAAIRRAGVRRNTQRSSLSTGPPFGLVRYRHDPTDDTRLIASALVAVVSLAILVFAYPPRALDHDRKADCREVRNTVGRIVARVCGERGENDEAPVTGARTDYSAPSSGLRIP